MFYESRQTLKHSLALQLRRLKFGAPGPKVFCVGFQKTGTTSLQYALSKLGYRVAGSFPVRDLETPDQMRDRAFELLPQFDAFADNPWGIFFREFDQAAPGSKFILTARDPEQWYTSVCKHFGEGSSPMREWIYGSGAPVGNKQAYVNRLQDHQADVRAYFAERPQDFMEFDVSKGDGWNALCGFLGKKVPSATFPRLNTAEMRK